MVNKEIVVALVGQPNCGKSTIFNSVAGFKVNTGNFSGTTVSYADTHVRVQNQAIKLIDLPGTYSISCHDAAERVTRDYLLSGGADIIINVIDASMLSRSLELTLQLLEMKIPMIVALNMMDEAERKGVTINTEAFTRLTGLQVVPVVAIKGQGTDAVFREVLQLARTQKFAPILPVYDREIEETLKEMHERYPASLRENLKINERFVAIRLLELDDGIENETKKIAPEYAAWIAEKRKHLALIHGWDEAGVLSSHRHGNVLDYYEKIATHKPRPDRSIRDRIDDVIMNPVGGIIAVILSLLLLFGTAFRLGDLIGDLIDRPFEHLNTWAGSHSSAMLNAVLTGFTQGVQAGAGIVLPYLVPLLFLLAIYEDTGFLPRIAFMVDGLLHRFGLHGKAVLPLVLGYGCSVPAIMSTRNMEDPRERLLAILVVPFIACSARSVVILGLVGKYLGPVWTVTLYLANMAVALLISLGLSRFKHEVSYGIIMDVPPLRRPYLKIAVKKVWLQLYDFLALGWPVLVISSIGLSILTLYGLDHWVNRIFSPLTTSALHLPPALGITLFLGFFRKELALVMLAGALGTSDVGSVLTKSQILTLTVFTVLYIPCISTMITIKKEGGWRVAGVSAALSISIALIVSSAIAWIKI